MTTVCGVRCAVHAGRMNASPANNVADNFSIATPRIPRHVANARTATKM
jgi:hypothetical protein